MKEKLFNFLLNIRLWFYVIFYKKRFKNAINPIEKKDYFLTFNDEFDGEKLDRSKWITQAYYGLRFHPGIIESERKAPSEYFSDDNFIFENSIMKQISKKENIEVNYTDYNDKNWGNYKIPYSIGQIQSVHAFEQKYGYFEIRSKMPSSLGMWPAFWLASKYDWPPEIDIYEIYTGKNKFSFESNIHWGNEPKHPSKVAGHKVLNVESDFHLYACEWTQNHIKFYYDNLLVRVFYNKKALDLFKYPMFVIIGNQVDNTPRGKIEQAVFPNYHEVDYVRVYKKF